jgi:hypothetical protein
LTRKKQTLLALLAKVEQAYALARTEVFDVVATSDTNTLSERQRQLLVDLKSAELELERYRARPKGR